ncbi:hypothetical protein F5Y15DRAFT_356452 [Xylariaceae sp. FL0016]|nr:hypothetical protein F5Y15DRAFT_356452 [Xylariaceae sp. FL0016]
MASPGIMEAGIPTETNANLSTSDFQGPVDDGSDWEYEYSNTETETFYVTLDLSKPEFTSQEHQQDDKPSEELNGSNESAVVSSRRRSASMSAADNSDAAPDVDEDEDRQGQGQRKRQLATEGHDDTRDRVQILDLHTANPIVSYRGRIYTGQWSENVTTEFLMTPRDDIDGLPALRHMANGVDLLAASSARITTKEKELKPAVKRQKRDHGQYTAENNASVDVIPFPEGKFDQGRVDQGHFLAKLITLKKQKGEQDEVTVIAKPTGKHYRESTGPQVTKQRRMSRPKGRPRTRNREGDEHAIEAQSQHIDDEDSGQLAQGKTPSGRSPVASVVASRHGDTEARPSPKSTPSEWNDALRRGKEQNADEVKQRSGHEPEDDEPDEPDPQYDHGDPQDEEEARDIADKEETEEEGGYEAEDMDIDKDI